MKKSTIFVILFYLFVIFSPSIVEYLFYLKDNVSFNPNDYARITDVDYTAVVDDSSPLSRGKVQVTELLTFDVHAASTNNKFWELWRDLVESEVDGIKVSYNVNYVNQVLPDGKKVPFKESPKLYWNDYDYISPSLGPEKWYHSKGPYNPDLRRYECVLFYVNGLYREKPVFEVNYDMYNAVLKYNDCSELYLSLYSEDTIKYLKSFKGQILVPNKLMPEVGNYDAHTFGTNSNSFPFEESNSKNPGYHTFSFELDKSKLKFSPYNKYIEFALVSHGKDKDAFSKFASENKYTSENVLEEIKSEQNKYDSLPNKFLKIKLAVFIGCLCLSLIIISKLLKADDNIENKYNFYKPSMQMDYFRDIPSNLDPTFAATLVFSKSKKIKDYTNIYSAILLSLIRKKYIEITKINEDLDWKPSNTNIILKYNKIQSASNMIVEVISEHQEEFEPLTKTEEYYWNLIVKHSKGSTVTMQDFQDRVSRDYMNTDAFVKSVAKAPVSIGVSNKYFQKPDYEEPRRILRVKAFIFAILGIFLLTFVNYKVYQTRLDFAFGGFTLLGLTLTFGAFIYYYLSKKYILLTQFGEDEYVKWRGLYNFLNSETLMNERTVVELPIWEQYLVYATAFGISEKVIRALEIRCPDLESSVMLNNRTYFHSNYFHTSCRSFSSATSYASSSYSNSSYGGFGGYGGGGRGGGGGRRRTLILKEKKDKQ